jgi:hypothetical protein
MIRRLLAAAVLLALASGPLLRLAVVSDYVVRNEVYLAACENLARPEMQCNGSCQLSKKLKAIEDQGAPEPLSAEWLKLKVSEFTVAATLTVPASPPSLDRFVRTVVPRRLGTPTDAVMNMVPPPKIG